MRDPGSHSHAAMRIYGKDPRILAGKGNRALTKNIKKGQRVGRNPKTVKVPMSPRRIVVFSPSADLKQRINGHAADNSEWQDPAEQFAGSISRNSH